ADGRLVERRLVEMPTNKVLLRVTYDDKSGVIRWLNADGKELVKGERKLGDGTEPELKPDTAKLVVLPLPYRTPAHVYATLGVDRQLLLGQGFLWIAEFLDEDTALELFTAEFASGDAHQAYRLYQACPKLHEARKLGFYTLLAAGGQPISGDVDFI